MQITVTWTRKHVLIALVFIPVIVLALWHASVYYWLCDDAFISFRYVRNFITGQGLVLNPGERVEGYTNFLWVLELAALWKFLGVRPEAAATILSVFYTLGTFLLTGLLAASAPVKRWRWPIAWCALFLLAINRTFAVWSTSGLETRQFTFFILLTIVLLRHYHEKPIYALWAALALAACEYTRPEGTMVWGCCCACLVVDALARRIIPIRAALFMLLFLVPLGAHFLFRHFYYGDWLPNTYYAKYIRPWPEMGLRYMALAAFENGLYVWLPFALIGGLVRLVKKDGVYFLAGYLIVMHAAYVIRIGGDHFEYRMLDFYWPILAAAAAEGIFFIADLIAGKAPGRISLRRAGALAAVGLMMVIVTVYTASLQIARYQTMHNVALPERTVGLYVAMTPENVPWLYRVPLMSRIAPRVNLWTEFCVAHSVAIRQHESKAFWLRASRAWSPYERMTNRGLIPPDLVELVSCLGIKPFYLADLKVIDNHGLADHYIARLPFTTPNDQRRMAHDRQAPPEYIKERGCNVTTLPAKPTRLAALECGEFAMKVDDDLWMPFNIDHSVVNAGWVGMTFAGRQVYMADPAQKADKPRAIPVTAGTPPD